jgi:hypothetical protein
VNLVSKYGDALPADTPIVGFASVAAYYSYRYMNIGRIIASPVVIKTDGKWELWDLRAVHDGSSQKDHSPLFLVDIDKKYDSAPKSRVSMFLRAGDILGSNK